MTFAIFVNEIRKISQNLLRFSLFRGKMNLILGGVYPLVDWVTLRKTREKRQTETTRYELFRSAVFLYLGVSIF